MMFLRLLAATRDAFFLVACLWKTTEVKLDDMHMNNQIIRDKLAQKP